MINKYSPYLHIEKNEWSSLNIDLKLNITESELQKYCSLNDIISLKEVENTYLPLSRLLNLYFRTKLSREKIINQFIGKQQRTAPFIISIAGSVAVGKSTTARLLQAILQNWKSKPNVALVTTDGFLYPNSVLIERNILHKKGFPISYDMKKLITFVNDIKSGKSSIDIPVYSHLSYDIIPNKTQTITSPDILIIEGLNVLQSGMDYPQTPHHVFLSDYVDFSIFVDAPLHLIKKWYIERFLTLRKCAFSDEKCFFHKYASLSEDEAIAIASSTWDIINYTNLIENILPTKERASLILEKGEDHEVQRVMLRK